MQTTMEKYNKTSTKMSDKYEKNQIIFQCDPVLC